MGNRLLLHSCRVVVGCLMMLVMVMATGDVAYQVLVENVQFLPAGQLYLVCTANMGCLVMRALNTATTLSNLSLGKGTRIVLVQAGIVRHYLPLLKYSIV